VEALEQVQNRGSIPGGPAQEPQRPGRATSLRPVPIQPKTQHFAGGEPLPTDSVAEC
jgi:hypothetical protein